MKLALTTVVLVLSVFSVSADKARFDNYRIYSIDVETVDQLKALRELSETSDSVRIKTTKLKFDCTINDLLSTVQFL